MNRRRFLQLGGAAIAATTGGVGYGWWSNTLTVQTYSVSVWGLPKPLRLGVLSDLHAPNYQFCPIELIAIVNSARCDLLVVAGDSVDEKGNESLVRELFGPMDAPFSFAVLGNWEYWSRVNLRMLRSYYEEAGVKLLVNEEAVIQWRGTELRIVGLDDLLGGSPDLGLLEKERSQPTLVLSHCPATAEEIASRVEAATLIISGHTHGGQIAPFGVVLWLPPGSGSFVRGWYKVGRSLLYVSPGLGNSVVPFRIGSRPTLAILDLI